MSIMARPDGTPTVFRDDVRAAFLLAYERSGSVNAAAASAGVSERVVRYHRDTDPEFRDEMAAALGRLDEEMMRQVKHLALEGVEEPIFDKLGTQIGTKRRYSERVLLAWLKRLESGSWLDRQRVEVAGTVQHEHSGRIEVADMTPEQRLAARRFLATLPDAPDPSSN